MARTRKKQKKVSTNLSFSSSKFVDEAKTFAFDTGENSLSELVEKLLKKAIEQDGEKKPPIAAKQSSADGPANRVSRSA